MENEHTFEKDLASIHQLMERSVKFVSLSGLSGVLAGVYALLGATAAYYLFISPSSIIEPRQYPVHDIPSFAVLLGIGAVVLVASIGTGMWMSARKAKHKGVEVWGPAGKRLFINLIIPLATGGLFVLICLWQGYYDLVASSTLIFYGLALVNASPNLFNEVRYLGFCEIILGLIAMLVPGYSLLFWAVGFGVLHILYGLILFRKYE